MVHQMYKHVYNAFVPWPRILIGHRSQQELEGRERHILPWNTIGIYTKCKCRILYRLYQRP